MTAVSNSPAQARGAALSVEDLSVGYGDVPVLADLSFRLPAGASLAIVGESGCGKTTLLTAVAGLKAAAKGSIRWTDAEGGALPKLRSSFVWQGLGLFPWKTVRQNLALPFELKNSVIPKSQAKDRVAGMLAELGLTGLEDRWPSALSGGQRQRLALGRALIGEPEVLFMDEPFSALDALRRERLQDFLAAMRVRRGVTMVFVTHDIPEAVFLASHILLLAANPPRLLKLYENPAWQPDLQCANRESPYFYDAIRHVHSTLREAAISRGEREGN
ncbi:ABC transporter ATP-binding protein [Sutterella sp.]|uniref:ABC transporter ATP-binding protein n=1 Tax=Sutterella sp. TaxID=1981025 RepID=UPI0026E0A8B1|nr:ABC transporter ATP-binding protein [Sutterella sp.]MDO5530789.1 ABC transporter ATP-binding protein [Sutterella sp.]